MDDFRHVYKAEDFGRHNKDEDVQEQKVLLLNNNGSSEGDSDSDNGNTIIKVLYEY